MTLTTMTYRRWSLRPSRGPGSGCSLSCSSSSHSLVSAPFPLPLPLYLHHVTSSLSPYLSPPPAPTGMAGYVVIVGDTLSRIIEQLCESEIAPPSPFDHTHHTTPTYHPVDHTHHATPTSHPADHTHHATPTSHPADHTHHATPTSHPADHTHHVTPTSHPAAVLSFGSDPPSWAVDTTLIKVVAIVMVMLPISLLRNIAMLEKVRLAATQLAVWVGLAAAPAGSVGGAIPSPFCVPSSCHLISTLYSLPAVLCAGYSLCCGYCTVHCCQNRNLLLCSVSGRGQGRGRRMGEGGGWGREDGRGRRMGEGGWGDAGLEYVKRDFSTSLMLASLPPSLPPPSPTVAASSQPAVILLSLSGQSILTSLR